VVAKMLAVKVNVSGGVSTADLKIMKSIAKLFLIQCSGIYAAATEVCTAVIAILVIPGVRKGNCHSTFGYCRISAVLNKLPTLI
jgi:hypothetical protein